MKFSRFVIPFYRFWTNPIYIKVIQYFGQFDFPWRIQHHNGSILFCIRLCFLTYTLKSSMTMEVWHFPFCFFRMMSPKKWWSYFTTFYSCFIGFSAKFNSIIGFLCQSFIPSSSTFVMWFSKTWFVDWMIVFPQLMFWRKYQTAVSASPSTKWWLFVFYVVLIPTLFWAEPSAPIRAIMLVSTLFAYHYFFL